MSSKPNHKWRIVTRWLAIALVTVLLVSARDPLAAAPSTVPSTGLNTAAGPHLGYGIHIAPWTPIDPGTVTALGVDWIKIYNPDQAQKFPRQRALYRVDVRGRPGNLNGSYEHDMRELAKQLSRQGVEAVEIGNEPNLGPEWGDTPPNAADYVSVLRVAYRAFKSVAPHIVVVSAGLAPTPGTPDGMNVDDLVFAQQMLDAGAAGHLDAFGYHPYGFDKPPETDPYTSELVYRRTERMYRLLRANGVHNKQMWLTEFGWLRDPTETGQSCAGEGDFDLFAWSVHSSADQAAYTVRAFQFADANWPWVGPMFLWNLDWNVRGNSQVSRCSHLRLFSILHPNGEPLPAYYAFQSMPKRYVVYGPPAVGAVVKPSIRSVADGGRINGMSRTLQAGCAGMARLGSFTVVTTGSPASLNVEVEAVNGPGLPRTWTSTDTATNGTEVSVFVDARDTEPGLYQIAVNLRAYGEERLTTHALRGWLLVHFPTDPECVFGRQFSGQATSVADSGPASPAINLPERRNS
jgi:hypothetical protein